MPGTSLAAESEWSVLVAACSADHSLQGLDAIKSLLRSPLHWNRLFDLSEGHGVQPLLYRALAPFKDSIPPEYFNVLSEKYRTNLHKALILSRELVRIVDELTANKIEVVPYKGVALSEAIYGDMALRQTGDIDLLIHAADLRRIREALQALGYTPHSQLSARQERAYLQSGYECVFDSVAGRNLLEVQWAIQPRFYAVDLDTEELFRRAATVSVAGHGMRALSFEDLFIVLSLHAAKHVWGRLIWLCDLARVIKLERLDWARIGSRARGLRILRILRISLVLAKRMLGTPIPSGAEENVPEDRQTDALADEIETHILSAKHFDIESVGYFRLMLRLRENPIDRLRFLSRLILTPGPGEWGAIRLPNPLFPLYRVVRVSRLAARLMRL